MGLNLEKMKNKLSDLTGGGRNADFWKPNEGESNIRIVPTADGDPFKDFWFHYNVSRGGFLCPKRNFGDRCPVCDFANKLWDERDDESRNLAKSFFAKQRFFSPVLVRGEESDGVRVWGYGKMAYEKLLNIVLDPDYGDVTDCDSGNDLKITYGYSAGATYPRTDIRPRPRKTVLCDDAVGGEERCAELLEKIPDFDTLFERKSTDDVQELLDEHLESGKDKEEVTKFGTNSTTNTPPKATIDSVDTAFNDLLNG